MLAQGALAVSLSSNGPVTIKTCTTGIVRSEMLYKTDGNYRISFVNTDDRTADLVQFFLQIGGQTLYIKDAGTFATGSTVSHYFGDRGGEIAVIDEPSISCFVKRVHFSDGTDWQAPSESEKAGQ